MTFPLKNRFKTKLALAILLAAALIAGVAVFAVVSRNAAAPPVTFLSLKGESIPMSQLRGKVVLVEFWATDCTTCVREMPQLVQTYRKYGPQGFETIAVAMRYDPPNYVIAYTRRNDLPFTVALDPMGVVAKAFGDVKLTPTTFVIDRQGRIVKRILGERDFTQLHALIEEKLKEPA